MCLPHARGGVSKCATLFASLGPSSPRPWGCFSHDHKADQPGHVFPTPVGVFPPYKEFAMSTLSLPHARGGVSGIIRL